MRNLNFALWNIWRSFCHGQIWTNFSPLSLLWKNFFLHEDFFLCVHHLQTCFSCESVHWKTCTWHLDCVTLTWSQTSSWSACPSGHWLGGSCSS